MIKLIENEFTKIFKKKSIWIVGILIILFIVGLNVISKIVSERSTDFLYYSEDYVQYLKEDLEKLDAKDPSDYAQYIETKTNLDVAQLCLKYDEQWQNSIIEKYIKSTITEYNQYYYSIEEKSQDDIQKEKELKEQYDEQIAKLDAKDWRYFAEKEKAEKEKEIRNIEEQLNNTVSNTEKDQLNMIIEQRKVELQAVDWRLDKDIPYGNNHLSNQIENYVSSKIYLITVQFDENEYLDKQNRQSYIEEAELAKYDIENLENTQKKDSAKGILEDVFSNYELLIIVVIVMIAGVMVSEEFNKGTIKLLLVRPYSRNKILLAKFVTSMLMILVTVVFIIGVQFIAGGIVYGFDSYGIPVSAYDFNNETVVTMNVFVYLIIITLTKIPIYILIATLSFALSTLCNNSPVAIALPLLGYMGSSMINMLAVQYELNWLKFFVTPNWDLTQYLFGKLPMFENSTLLFSIVVCLIYMVIMLIPTFIVFKKKNIKNI